MIHDFSVLRSVIDRPLAEQTVLETLNIVSRLSGTLRKLKAELSTVGTPPTAFVSVQTPQDENGQGMMTPSAKLDHAQLHELQLRHH